MKRTPPATWQFLALVLSLTCMILVIVAAAPDPPAKPVPVEHQDPRDGRVWLDVGLGDWKACAGDTLVIHLAGREHEVPYSPECGPR